MAARPIIKVVIDFIVGALKNEKLKRFEVQGVCYAVVIILKLKSMLRCI